MQRPPSIECKRCDIAIIGAGAAGLAAAIFAGEAAAGSGLRIVLIESAKKPGAKILVSGGGRCNVTNNVVTDKDYWGGSPHTIRKVFDAFSNQDAIDWFHRIGVSLKREPSGKFFPKTDQAQTVLAALLNRVRELGVELVTGHRVTHLRSETSGFVIEVRSERAEGRRIHSRRVIVATGGLALPKSGSDGVGLSLMQELGHTIVPTTPALTPLVLKRGPSIGGRFADFSGITIEARLRLCRGDATRPLIELDGSLVFTHFGISGPVAMDLSRHWLRARLNDPETPLRVLLGVPALKTIARADEWLRQAADAHPRRLVATALEELLPSRIAHALAAAIGDRVALSQLSRDQRRRLAGQLVETLLEVKGTRGYTHAEATAGGVDLREIDWRTMASRKVPGLHLCGEILDVDGRIGGFNFQWAWSSGYLAGRGAVATLRA
ncbi:MAG TPA: NAD(P)/FAD-dependent oxidoreductase [Acidobacteriota bacterium]|nr:NAD(P)/FAD-dependent oxidoreductase [Acidobacteriota bacterium]